MRRSHLCAGCGLDLASERSAWVPSAGSHVVHCPRCGMAGARHAPPALVRRRVRVRLRLVAGLLRLAGQWILGVGLTLLTIGVIHAILEGGFQNAPIAGLEFPMALPYALVPVLAGAWLAAGLAHWPRWTPWIAWTAVIALTPPLLPLLDDSTGHVDRLGSALQAGRRTLPWSGLAAGLALAGLPIGRGLIALDHRRRQAAAARRFAVARRRAAITP